MRDGEKDRKNCYFYKLEWKLLFCCCCKLLCITMLRFGRVAAAALARGGGKKVFVTNASRRATFVINFFMKHSWRFLMTFFLYVSSCDFKSCAHKGEMIFFHSNRNSPRIYRHCYRLSNWMASTLTRTKMLLKVLITEFYLAVAFKPRTHSSVQSSVSKGKNLERISVSSVGSNQQQKSCCLPMTFTQTLIYLSLCFSSAPTVYRGFLSLPLDICLFDYFAQLNIKRDLFLSFVHFFMFIQ